LELVDRRDAELAPDASRGLRPETGQPHEEDDLGRNDVPALRQCVHLAVVNDLDDLLLDRLPNPVELLRPSGERELRDRAGGLADACRGAPVGENAEGRLSLELEEVGEEVELVCDVAVAWESLDLRHPSIIRTRSRRVTPPLRDG